MDLINHFSQKRTSENLAQAVAYIGFNKGRFKELMTLFFSPDDKLSARAAHAVSHCVDRTPNLLIPYISTIVAHLDEQPNVAVKRNIVRLLQSQTIPKEAQGTLTTHCFDFLQDSKEAVAVKAFSMTILVNMCHSYPELINELALVIQDLMENGSSGIKNRGLKTLAQLKKMSSSLN